MICRILFTDKAALPLEWRWYKIDCRVFGPGRQLADADLAIALA